MRLVDARVRLNSCTGDRMAGKIDQPAAIIFDRVQTDFDIDHNCRKYLDVVQDALSREVMAAPPMITGVDYIEAEAYRKEPELPAGIEMTPLVQEVLK